MRRLMALGLVLLLGACGQAPVRQRPASSATTGKASVPVVPVTPAAVRLQQACAPTRQHRDSDYTRGGLYAPGVSDSAPSTAIDISGVIEPTPRGEPLAHYGNRTPYTVLGHSYHVLASANGYAAKGIASWYGEKFNGRGTSSGETYDICSFTAAHKTLPLPSYVRVTNLDNGRSVIVRVNDRGPFHDGRLIDLSYAAAVRLGVDRTGTARVDVRAVTDADPDRGPATASSFAAANAPAANRAPSNGRSIVQVGSFGDKSNAKRVADQLEDAGIDDVDIDHVEVNGRDLWRVQVGPVKAGRLSALLDRIRALGLTGSRVFSE